MHMYKRLVAFAALFQLSFSLNTHSPLLAWSNDIIGEALALAGVGEQDFTNLINGKDLCSLDAVVVIDQPGLNTLDLKALSPSSAVSSRLKASSESIQRPYARRHASRTLSDSSAMLARRCGSQMLWLDSNDLLEFDVSRGKHVIYLTVPFVEGEGPWRKVTMSETDVSLNKTMSAVERNFPKHLFIYTGSYSSDLERRQDGLLADDLPFSFAAANSTGTGILANYQLLTPGLIVSLFVAFFVLLPIILMAVQALSSIQSSVRLENRKAVGQEKKTQ